MEKFLLLIREDLEQLRKMSEEEFNLCILDMTQWIEELAQSGNFVAGEPLSPAGKYLNRDKVLSDGPFIEAKEAISGYFIIKAENLNQATSITQSCPQLIKGRIGIEVRPIINLQNE